MNRSRYIVVAVGALMLTLSGCAKQEESVESLLKQERYEEAIDRFQELTEDKDQQAEAYRGMGIAYWELGDYQQARAAFEKALSYGAKETGSICHFMGVCELQLGYPESAGKWFEKGLEKEGNSAEAIQEMEFNQIVVAEQMEEWELAKERLSSYTEKHPDDETAAKELEFLETR